MAYVYRHIRLDKNVPFYIGIGESKYRSSTKHNRNIIWERIVAKTKYSVEVLFDKGYWKGKKMSEDFKKKMSIAKKGKSIKGHPQSDKAKNLLRKRNKGNSHHLGIRHSEESKLKMSESKIGKISPLKGKPAPWLIGNLNGMYGKKHSTESRQKNSDSQKKVSIIQCSMNGNFIKEYPSITSAAKENNIFITGIQANCKGRFTSYKRFIWKYKY